VATERTPDLRLYFDILQTLDRINAPYMIIGGFAAAIYGNDRTTYDIDIVVDLKERHVQALAAAYPAPRCYTDPAQMRDSLRRGISFNIIDGKLGDKVDLSPLTRDSRYRAAFQHRVRQTIDLPDGAPFEAWCARPEDVIVGKLMAWAEGRSSKHEIDIYGMMLAHYMKVLLSTGAPFDEGHVSAQAKRLGDDVFEFWSAINEAARDEVERHHPEDHQLKA
jgi:Nucleotidyl transferase AbiEii toxin, Type IV TA system